MIRMYTGGWDCREEDVARWIAEGSEPVAVYNNYEEAAQHAYEDAGIDCDEYIFFVYEDGTIVEFTEW